PFVVEGVAFGGQVGGVEQGELLVAATEDEALHDRLEYRVRVDRHGHGDPERVTDRPVLAQEHVEDDAVDPVVSAEVGEDSDRARALPEAVDAPLALLVTGRVPGEVVVDDRVEVLLEVDSLGQAIGGDENALLDLGKRQHTLLPLGWWELASDRFDG